MSGKPTAADGPMSAGNEQIGAFSVLEAQHIDEAIRIASLRPGVHLGKYFGGGMEVRACDTFEQY